MKRLIYAEDAMHRIEIETRFYSGTYAEIERAIDSAPTVDQRCLQPVEEWISVKDRLPEASKLVLVCEVAYGSIYIAYRLPDSKKFIHVMSGHSLDCATHWMPLPQPPKGE